VRLDKTIAVGCMSNVVHAFSLRGKKSYSIYLPAAIVSMELLALSKTRTAKAILISLATGEVRLYNEKHLIATMRIDEPVMACRFGSYGREEGCLAVIGTSGALTIKILQRTTKFDVTSSAAGPPPEQESAGPAQRLPHPHPHPHPEPEPRRGSEHRRPSPRPRRRVAVDSDEDEAASSP
jgi:Bardet-Biedl syndrome 1 protein